MAKSMTIEQVKKAKIELESKILELMRQFEKDTDVKLGYIETQRKHKNSDTKGALPEPYEPYKGPISNVNVSMELDVIYD